MMTWLTVIVLTGYKLLISPLLPSCCRFWPTCSEYAKLALMEHGFPRGIGLALMRLARCHPLNPGGYDPPPAAHRPLA